MIIISMICFGGHSAGTGTGTGTFVKVTQGRGYFICEKDIMCINTDKSTW